MFHVSCHSRTPFVFVRPLAPVGERWARAKGETKTGVAGAPETCGPRGAGSIATRGAGFPADAGRGHTGALMPSIKQGIHERMRGGAMGMCPPT